MAILCNKLGSIGKGVYNISVATELWWHKDTSDDVVTSWLHIGTVDRDDMRIYKLIVLGLVVSFGVVRKK